LVRSCRPTTPSSRSWSCAAERRRGRLAEALGAFDLALADADLAAIEWAVPAGAAAGDRYPAPQMAHLDSEG
jgi:hypothetical protein